MTLTTLLASCYRRLRYTSAPPAAITTRLTEEINEVHGDILTRPEIARLRDDTIAITALSGVARAGLPTAVSRVNGVTDRTNNYTLREVPLKDLRLMDPAQASTGSYPQCYAVIGNLPVFRQPASGVSLRAASTSALDTTQHVFVESINFNGDLFKTAFPGVILTGTAEVVITSVSQIEITRFYLDAVCAGDVSLTSPSAAITFATIPAGQTFSRYWAVEWWPTPTANIVEYVDIQRNIVELSNATDEPLIPPDFHDTIVQGVLYREYVLAGDARAPIAQADYERGIANLMSWVMDDGNRLVSTRQIGYSWNLLGPRYANEPPWWQGF